MRDIERMDESDRPDLDDHDMMLEDDHLDDLVAEQLEDELKAEEKDMVDLDLPEKQGLN